MLFVNQNWLTLSYALDNFNHWLRYILMQVLNLDKYNPSCIIAHLFN